jgi:hypothetical protein
MSAGTVSHSNPFKRKNMNPQNPSFLIQLFRLIALVTRFGRWTLDLGHEPHCILPHDGDYQFHAERQCDIGPGKFILRLGNDVMLSLIEDLSQQVGQTFQSVHDFKWE